MTLVDKQATLRERVKAVREVAVKDYRPRDSGVCERCGGHYSITRTGKIAKHFIGGRLYGYECT